MQIFIFGVLLNAGPLAVHADSWAAPETRLVNSPSGNYSLLISPNEIGVDRSNAQLMLVTKNQKHGLTTLQFPPVNRISPVDAFISNDGLILTLNDWLQSGYDHAIVVYNKDGKIVRDSQLEDIFQASTIEKFPRSVSSRDWLYRGEPIEMKGNTVRMTSILGYPLYVYLETGQIEIKRSLRFPRLLRHLRKNKHTLWKVEYDDWGEDGHIRCSWEEETSKCERLDEDWNSSAISETKVQEDRLLRPLLQVFTRARNIEHPNYCAAGCSGQQKIRVFFGGQADEGWTKVWSPKKGNISYQVSFESSLSEPKPMLDALSELLGTLGFLQK